MNVAGVELLKQFEGYRLEAYLDPVGIATIGWGATGPEIQMGLTWTQEQADQRLVADTQIHENNVSKLLRVSTNENQLAAMASLSFNIGQGNFAKSTVLKCHNASNFASAADAFSLWTMATNSGGEKVKLKGLVLRRAAEATLYLKSVPGFEEEILRTRATDVEAAPQPGDDRIRKASYITGGAVTALGTATQVMGQTKDFWTQMQDLFGHWAPHILFGALGAGTIGAVIYGIYAVIRKRA